MCRDPSLGFKFGGGSDRPAFEGDSNVYITHVVAGGAAAKDGRLKVGDRVLWANGTQFDNVEYVMCDRVVVLPFGPPLLLLHVHLLLLLYLGVLLLLLLLDVIYSCCCCRVCCCVLWCC